MRAVEGMLDGHQNDERETERRRALLAVERMLTALPGERVRRLSDHELRGSYGTRNFDVGWRLPVTFSDGTVRRLDVVASNLFPFAPVRTALVDRPVYLTWPHIEHDGVLCVLANWSEIDADQPEMVAGNILNRSVRLVEELIDGAIIERDFREEFLTYWFYGATDSAVDVLTLFDPSPPSRVLRGYRYDAITYVAEDDDALTGWLAHRFGAKVSEQAAKKTRPVASLWLERPLLPDSYPQTGADVMRLACEAGEDAVDALRQAAMHDGDTALVLLCAEGRGGAGLMPVHIARGPVSTAPGRSRGSRLQKGFRPHKMPADVKLSLTFGGNKVRRAQVARADAAWIHGRGQDPRSALLYQRSVTIFGCGSIGSFVAENLARSGVGTIYLVDFDKLAWANVGRHALGARSVGKNKAVELSKKLQGDFPHLLIEGCDWSAGLVVRDRREELLGADLLISTMGSWSAEHALNRWHCVSNRPQSILYGWTEEHAMSGSAVVISPQGGCLQCGLDNIGRPIRSATVWPSDRRVYTEPACSDRFEPYGAIELSTVTSLISQTALGELLEPSIASYRMVSVADERRIRSLGGSLSDLVPRTNDTNLGNISFRTSWGKMTCPACCNNFSEHYFQ